jgi:uncharacterized membrane protein YqjE
MAEPNQSQPTPPTPSPGGAGATPSPGGVGATPPPAGPAVTPPPAAERKSVADLVFDVSERSSVLIREEIELAKAEISEKVAKILRGSAVGIAAGVFAFLALILAMHGIAWFLNEELFDGKTWPGFFIEAAIFLLVAALAGYLAFRSLKAGAPPLPEQAIEEAKRTKEMLEKEAS